MELLNKSDLKSINETNIKISSCLVRANVTINIVVHVPRDAGSTEGSRNRISQQKERESMHDMSFVSDDGLPKCKTNLIRQKRALFEKRGGGMSSAKQEGSRSTRTGGHRDVYNACRESNQSGSQMPCSTSRSWNVRALSGRGCLANSRVTDNSHKMVEEIDARPAQSQDANTTDVEPDLEYGPGIVNKLKSRFIHLTLKDSEKRRSPLRRFCSLENLVQEEPFQANDPSKGDGAIVWRNRAKYGLSSCGKTNFKKAQSMETLVTKSDERNREDLRTSYKPGLVNENIVIVEKAKAGNDERHDSVADEELPRPDTVKTYKRMFEPAESKPVHRRRAPVLRASAKSNKSNSSAKLSAIVNGDESNGLVDSCRLKERRVSPPIIVDGLVHEKKDPSKNPSQNLPATAQGSLVFDFRGKSTKPNVSLQPTPFGCKPVQKAVKKSYRLFDGLEGLPAGTLTWEDDDEDELDGQTDLPHPSGITFVGENVRMVKNCLLSTRNKNLTIHFNDNATSIHEYPSETSLLENHSTVNGIHDEANSSSLTFSGGLANYTPKGLETVKSFQLGVVKPRSQLKVPEINDAEEKETEVLKPADPDSTFSWSSSTTTSDLLF